MQIGGKPRKVKLLTDLTKYDARCVIGSTGTTMPNHRVGLWGDLDTFVAVHFDNGAILDVLYKSIEIAETDKATEFKNELKKLMREYGAEIYAMMDGDTHGVSCEVVIDIRIDNKDVEVIRSNDSISHHDIK